MRLAFFSPIPPIASGLSDYSAELLEYLAPLCEELVVYVDECGVPFPAHNPKYKVFHYRCFTEHQAARPYDQFCYTIGNNELPHYVYPYMLRFPGVIVLHDIHISHHRLGYHLSRRRNWETYRGELYYSHPEQGPKWFDLIRASLENSFITTTLHTNRVPVESSRGVIVHSDYGVQVIREQSETLPVLRVNHHYHDGFPEFAELSKAEHRAQLGIPERADPVIGTFGYINGIKRDGTILEVFSKFIREFPKAHLYFVGNPDIGFKLFDRIDSLGLKNHVTVTGYVDEETFFRYVHAVDFSLSLRYPTCGETSGTLIRCMGKGVPVVVSRYKQFAEYPEDLVTYVDFEDEHRSLYQAMRKLTLSPELRADLGRRSRAYMLENYRIEDSARKYYEFLSATSRLPRLPFIAREPQFNYLAEPHGDSSRMVKDLLRFAEQDEWLSRFPWATEELVALCEGVFEPRPKVNRL